MLARLHIILPFSLTIPEGETFSIYSYVEKGYEIRIYPPVKSDQPSPRNDADELFINEKPGFQANALRIDFTKDTFDRRTGSECDPPHELIQQTLNLFLRKLRFVTRGFQITLVDYPHKLLWHLQYLNGDGTELEKTEGLIRVRGGQTFNFSAIAITSQIWNDIHALPADYSPPEWDSLYLDALAALPDVGLAIVLAATSLEVFISHILDALAQKTVVPQQLWHWINNREWLREPTVAEQFDELLKALLGLSLKEDKKLWEAFKNLKTARNSFVHDGIAKIGNKPVTEAEARKLIEHTEGIFKFIKAKLPDELHWPEYQHTVNFTFQKKLFGEEDKKTST